MPQSDSDRVHRHTLFVQGVGVSFAETVKLGTLDTGPLGDRFQPAQEVSVRLAFTVWKYQVVWVGIPLPHSVLDFPNELSALLGGLQ
jgi:hypothetical protein